MSFREKSAWAMALVMTTAGLYYYHVVASASGALGQTAPPAVIIGYVMFVVIASIVVQTMLALSSGKDADAPADERERRVAHGAGHWSGVVLAIGVVLSLGHYLVRADGNMLFHLVVASLIASQIDEYAFQILLLRRSF